MARAKKQSAPVQALPEAEARHELITDVIETNYMPYAMSVIISRAIPEIDGFKPVHRKLLYTMYTMGLMTGNRTKSTNIVGTTMKLHPHGIPRQSLIPSVRRSSAAWTKTRWTWCQTTTIPRKSLPCSRPPSRTFWSPPIWVSRSAWHPISARST